MSKKEHHNLSKMNARPIKYPEDCKTINRKKEYKNKTLQKYEDMLFSDSGLGHQKSISFFSKNKEEWLQTAMKKYPGFKVTLTNDDGSIHMNPEGMFDVSGKRLPIKFDEDFQEMKKDVSKMKMKKQRKDNFSPPAKRQKRQEDPTTSNTQGGGQNEGGGTSGLTNAKKRARPSDDDN